MSLRNLYPVIGISASAWRNLLRHVYVMLQMTGCWIKMECHGIFWNWRPGSYRILDIGLSWERSQVVCSKVAADNARNNIGSHTREADQKQHGWTTFFSGLDTHWTRHSCILKTESSGDRWFMVRPSLGTRTAEGKARQVTDNDSW